MRLPGGYESHPLADAFPMMQGAELAQLVTSMRERGFDPALPIIRICTKATRTTPTRKLVLDGRNRLVAATEAGIKPQFSDHEIREDGTADGLGEITKFVIARNLARRHLSESQRGLIAAKLASLAPGRPKGAGETPSRDGVSRAAAAAQLGIGTATVDRAAKVLREADPKVVEAVEQGQLSVAGAAKIAKRPPAVQRKIVEQVQMELAETPGRELDGAKVTNILKRAERSETAQRIEAEPPPMPLGPFRVIVTDYPWPFDARVEDDTQRGKTDYPVMSLEGIEQHFTHEVSRLEHPEGTVVFFWAVNEFLEEALAIVRRAGWRKRSIITWDKERIGLGNTYRNVTEHVIVATKGDAAIHVTSQSTLIREARRAHSQKPEAFYQLVEETCPGSKVELFARTRRVGWTGWGAEVGKFGPVLDVGGHTSGTPPASTSDACSDPVHGLLAPLTDEEREAFEAVDREPGVPFEDPPTSSSTSDASHEASDPSDPDRFVVGARVRVLNGHKLAGRTGRIDRRPKLITDHAYVELDPTPREKTAKCPMVPLLYLELESFTLAEAWAGHRPDEDPEGPAARSLCIDCEHPECPGEPDCGACPRCVACQLDDVTDEAVAVATPPAASTVFPKAYSPCEACGHSWELCPEREGVDCPQCLREGKLDGCVYSTSSPAETAKPARKPRAAKAPKPAARPKSAKVLTELQIAEAAFEAWRAQSGPGWRKGTVQALPDGLIQASLSSGGHMGSAIDRSGKRAVEIAAEKIAKSAARNQKRLDRKAAGRKAAGARR